MLIAPFGAAAFYLGWVVVSRDLARLDIALGISLLVVAYSGAAGLVLVLPVLLFVPSLRTPSSWVATAWGTGAALLTCLLLSAPMFFRGTISSTFFCGGLGAASGLTYALAARALLKRQRAV